MERDLRLAAVLRVAGSLGVVLVAVWLAWAHRADWGAFVLVLGGVPTVAVVPVLVGTLRGGPARVVTWVASAVVLAWSLLTGLGAGFAFVGPGVVLLIAGATTTGAMAGSSSASR